MSERVNRANRDLHALEAAYQRGELDRAEFRARRRGVLSALRVRDEITARNALVPGAGHRSGGFGTGQGEGRDSVSSILFASRWALLPRWLLFAGSIGIGALLIAMVWFVTGGADVR